MQTAVFYMDEPLSVGVFWRMTEWKATYAAYSVYVAIGLNTAFAIISYVPFL